jgi:hypothetical protein
MQNMQKEESIYKSVAGKSIPFFPPSPFLLCVFVADKFPPNLLLLALLVDWGL